MSNEHGNWKVKRNVEIKDEMAYANRMSVRLMYIIGALTIALIYSTCFVRAQTGGCGNLPNCTDPRHYITTNSADEQKRQENARADQLRREQMRRARERSNNGEQR